MRSRRVHGVLCRLHMPALAFTLALGILIWMKLRLVTGATRSAYANPDVQQKQDVRTPLIKEGLRDHPSGEAAPAAGPVSGQEAEMGTAER